MKYADLITDLSGAIREWYTRPVHSRGGAPESQRITFAQQYENNEGPLIFRDNVEQGLFHLWIDENTLQTYIPGRSI